MLVWLASYPRSGNTLLRQVLKGCFDLSSCDGLDVKPHPLHVQGAVRSELYGSYSVSGDPEEFYQRARSGSELVLLKSHQMPRDAEKAIYVVRDGRLALKSFIKYQDTYHPGASSFESLLIGDHVYGEWTTHYRDWCGRERGETLVLRFEELVDTDVALLARLAEFLGLPGPLRPWVNPQAQLRELAPVVFGPGHALWQPEPFWTETRLRQFLTLHGPLLAELGYATAEDVRAGAYPPGSDEERMLWHAHGLAARARNLQAVCDERRAQIDLLAGACASRLAQIERLTTACDERLALLHQLTGAVHERDERLAALEQKNAALLARPQHGRLRRFVASLTARLARR
jgi:hypothetical protein